MGKENDFALEVVSVRLVRDAPILSGTEINTAEDAVRLVGKELCDMDREVVCVINLRADRTPINCHFASVGVLDYSLAHPTILPFNNSLGYFSVIPEMKSILHHLLPVHILLMIFYLPFF